MKRILSAVCACAVAGAAWAAVDVVDGVLTVEVASGEQDGYTSDQLAAITGGTVTEIKKTGAGTLISKNIASYAGKITVSGGIFRLKDGTGLGTSAGATYVESSGSVSFDSNSCGSTSEELHIAGTGANDGGALILPGWGQVCKLVLEGDAKIVAGDRAETKKATGGFLDLQDHTLTIESVTAGAGEHYFSVNELRSVGTVVANNFRFFKVCSDVPLYNGKKGKFILRGTTALLCASADATNRDIRWDLEWETGSSGTTYVTASPFNWAGDWIIGSGRQAIFDAVTVNMYGNLIGAGDLYKGNSGTGEIRLYGTNRVDFTGNFLIRGGRVIVMKKEGLLPNCSTRVQFTNNDGAMFALAAKTDSNPDGFEASDIESFFTAMENKTTGVKGIYVAEGDTFTGSVTFDKANQVNTDTRGCDASKFGVCGGGTCILTGPYVGNPSLKILTYGDLRFSNPAADPTRVNGLGQCWIVSGSPVFEDAGTLDFGGKNVFCSGSVGSGLPKLTFTGNTRVVNVANFYTPNDGNNQNGRAVFGSGVVATNRFSISTDGSMNSGSVVVNGGDVTSRGSDCFIGSYGQGAILVESGKMTVQNHNFYGNQPTSVGQLFVNGGTYASTYSIHLGSAGTGIVYQTSGTINSPNGICLGYALSDATQRPHSEMTQEGGEFLATTDVTVGSRANAVSMLNLNGGSFQARRIVAPDVSGAWADVAFNGGTLKAAASTSSGWALLNGDNLTATVYAGGAAVDTSGINCSLGRPLVAATGKGVASITMPEASYAGFAAPPVVTIFGDGRGASAVPIYDSLSGTVTGIRVTSPGYGYTTATATMNRGNSNYYTTSIELGVTLADNTAPVKLTKKGEGTLTVASGLLPATAVVGIEAGALAGAGVTFTQLEVDAEKAETTCGTVPGWPDGATLSIKNLDRLKGTVGRYTLLQFADSAPTSVPTLASGCTLPQGWKLRVSGKKLLLTLQQGFVLVFR